MLSVIVVNVNVMFVLADPRSTKPLYHRVSGLVFTAGRVHVYADCTGEVGANP